MNTTAASHSVWDLVAQAGPVVQLVMLGLLVSSIISWALIAKKWKRFRGISQQAAAFEKEFWSGGPIAELAKKAPGNWPDNPMVRVFSTGFKEWNQWRTRVRRDPDFRDTDVGDLVAHIRRAMQVSLNREVESLEQGLTFLATVGSTAPFIGLFGTVWGIMNAFRGLAGAKSTTLTMVAPGIAEALIATAIGLIAAIPAVIAYNKFAADLRKLHQRMDNFGAEFLNIMERWAEQLIKKDS